MDSKEQEYRDKLRAVLLGWGYMTDNEVFDEITRLSSAHFGKEGEVDLYIKCPECGGMGINIIEACCRNTTPNGNCCGSSIQEREQCERCQATGFVPEPIDLSQPPSTHDLQEISEEEIIKDAREQYPKPKYGSDLHDPTEHAEKIGFIEGMKHYRSALRQRNQQGDKWISVDERLPDEDKFVSVVFSTLYMGGPVQDVGMSRLHNGRWANEMDRTKVTHWQPLPSPPRPVSGQDKSE